MLRSGNVLPGGDRLHFPRTTQRSESATGGAAGDSTREREVVSRRTVADLL